jgi:hypothetical protein
MSPYRIPGPARISFSGGRTSAYMLHEIVRAYDGNLPEDVFVVFANTGKERGETLRFVHECGSRWGVKINWVEWRDTVPGFEEVGYNSASRNGEPFAALIAKKGMPPNWQARFCTEFLKVRPMVAFMTARGYAAGSYDEVIGLRHDEPIRIFKMLERNERDRRRCVAPLTKAKITEPHVLAHWRAQPFDLGLEPGEGNCDLCFLKGRGLRKELIRRRPTSAEWWVNAEKSVNGFFDRRDQYSELVDEVRRSPDLFAPLTADHDVECGLLCQPYEPISKDAATDTIGGTVNG